jgi:hypothetical protein
MNVRNVGALLAALVGLACVSPARADVYVFDFENAVFGANTPATDPSETSATFTATFASPQDTQNSGGYQIYYTSGGEFTNLTGNYLGTNAFGNTLNVTFAAALSSLNLDFFLFGGATSLSYELLSGGVDGTLVSSGSALTSITDPDGYEGVLSVTAAPFDTIELLPDSGIGLAIDNISVTSADLPEPASIALLGISLASLGVVRRRRRG